MPRESPITVGDLTLYPDRYLAVQGGQEIELTRKQRDILQALMTHESGPLSYQELADRIGTPTRQSLGVHIKDLRDKLPNPGIVRTVYGIGLIIREPVGGME